MATVDAIESNDELQMQTDESSSDVRGAIQSAMKEVADRARDEQGRFSKAEEQAAATAAAEATRQAAAKTDVKPETGATGQDGQQQAPAKVEAIKPPDAWSPAAKAKFATLDPEIQQEVMRREVEVHKGFTKQDEHRNAGKAFTEAVTPYLPMIRAEGGNPVAAVQDLLQTAYTLRTAPQEQKQQMFLNIASQFGIDLQGVFNRLAGGQQQVNPQVAQLQQQLSQLQQRIASGDTAVQAQEQAQIGQTIESFASDPKNVFFADVKAEMAALLRSERAQSLQEAYDMACWARPDIRPHMLHSQEQQRATELKAKADKARAAGSSIAGSPSGSAGIVPVQERDLRDELRANFRAVMGRE